MHAKAARLRWSQAVTIALASVLALACGRASPPARWASGGAPLVLPSARWSTEDGNVEVRPDGKVTQDGNLVFVLDRVGRVVDDDYEPVALLMPEGAVVGTDNDDLGRIGRTNGAPPGSETAWFTVNPGGTVVFFDSEGDRYDAGRWSGCDEASLRTCTLVSHMFFVRAARNRRSSGVGMGIGIGYFR